MDGVRYQLSTGTHNRRQAERAFTKLKEEKNRERHQIVEIDPELTVADIAEKFKKGEPAPYNLDRLKHLLPLLGPIPMRQITRNTVIRYREARKAEKPNLKASTLNKDVGVLRHLLYWAMDEKLILTNPLVRVPMARERRVPKPVMSLEDEEKVLAVAKPHLKKLIIAALDTGMRKGELLSQRWEHVDLGRQLLFVSKSKTPEGEGREIPFTSRMVEILSRMKQESELVFTYEKLPILDVKTSWFTAQRRAGLTRHYRFHDLRHAFNSRLLEIGVIADVRKALMGHEDRSVHGRYTHVELPAKRAAIAKLDEWREREMRILQESHSEA